VTPCPTQDLDRCAADRTRGAVNQDRLTRCHLQEAERAPRRLDALRDHRGAPQAQRLGDDRKPVRCGHDVLGVAPAAHEARDAVADLEALDALAERIEDPGDLVAQDDREGHGQHRRERS